MYLGVFFSSKLVQIDHTRRYGRVFQVHGTPTQTMRRKDGVIQEFIKVGILHILRTYLERLFHQSGHTLEMLRCFQVLLCHTTFK
jgi:hypothetical protein